MKKLGWEIGRGARMNKDIYAKFSHMKCQGFGVNGTWNPIGGSQTRYKKFNDKNKFPDGTKVPVLNEFLQLVATMANNMINRGRPKKEPISYVVGNFNLTKDTGSNNLDGDIRKFCPPLCAQIETTCRKRKVSKSKYSIK